MRHSSPFTPCGRAINKWFLLHFFFCCCCAARKIALCECDLRLLLAHYRVHCTNFLFVGKQCQPNILLTLVTGGTPLEQRDRCLAAAEAMNTIWWSNVNAMKINNTRCFCIFAISFVVFAFTWRILRFSIGPCLPEWRAHACLRYRLIVPRMGCNTLAELASSPSPPPCMHLEVGIRWERV